MSKIASLVARSGESLEGPWLALAIVVQNAHP